MTGRPMLTVFADSPDGGRGLARDMPVRWALEEVGQPYDVRGVKLADLKEPAHRAIHPFGKIPVIEDGSLTLFESGAIVLHLARTRGGLLPDDADSRERAVMWMFAALSTLEPAVVEREAYLMLEKAEDYFEQRKPLLDNRVRERLSELSTALGASDWIEGEFSAGDLMLIAVLRRFGDAPILSAFANLRDYVARGEARPAFKRAFAAQKAWFDEGAVSAGS